MHPVELILYLSSILVHLIVTGHPIHMLFNMYFTTLGAVTSHTGYSSLLFKDRAVVDLGDFHHQLHHRYFDGNYGNRGVPLDKWFGSFRGGATQASRNDQDSP
jgi:sterol desaturase/sphingolipid hydroxylase (fatty acid hydroxylase superfamily)